MNKHLKSVLSASLQLFPPGERIALRLLFTEFRISRYHKQGLRQIRRKKLSRPLKINLGSGAFCKEGFLNVDLFPGGDVTLDLRRSLPFESNCCELIFSEHCIEHLDYPDVVSNVFRECFRVLKPHGLLRFSVPDTEWPLTEYSSGPEAEYFCACKKHSWHPSDCTTRLEHINFHFRQAGQHRFAYDEETATKALNNVGFEDVQRVSYDASIDSQHREVGSLFMSARKPVAFEGK